MGIVLVIVDFSKWCAIFDQMLGWDVPLKLTIVLFRYENDGENVVPYVCHKQVAKETNLEYLNFNGILMTQRICPIVRIDSNPNERTCPISSRIGSIKIIDNFFFSSLH